MVDLDAIPQFKVSWETLSKAFKASVKAWDGELGTLDSFILGVERFMTRNRSVVSKLDAIELVDRALPREYWSRRRVVSYQDVLTNIASKIYSDEVLEARSEFYKLQPVTPENADGVRETLQLQHGYFSKASLSHIEGICRLHHLLPNHLAKQVAKRLWLHKNKATYNFVRDLTLNMVKVHMDGNATAQVSGTKQQPQSPQQHQKQNRSTFSLLPHHPPYYCMDMPVQRSNEPTSCFQNRVRQMIESRERHGKCGFCLSQSHGWFDCDLKSQLWGASNHLLISKPVKRHHDDNFEPGLMQAKKPKVENDESSNA